MEFVFWKSVWDINIVLYFVRDFWSKNSFNIMLFRILASCLSNGLFNAEFTSHIGGVFIESVTTKLWDSDGMCMQIL